MASNSQGRFGSDGNGNGNGSSWQQRQSRVSEIAASHHRRNDESWVELASQPSSSSLSSIGDNEIVTTGLRVGNQTFPPRRRRLQQIAQAQNQTQNHMPSTYIVSHTQAQAGTSSQEEYDETESEEDHILTSSNEQLSPSSASAPLRAQQTALGPSTGTAGAGDTDSDENSDDDENSTALGVGRGSSSNARPSTSPTFRPQPNAFSHPPSNLHRHSTSSAVPQQPPSSRPPMATRAHTRPNRGSGTGTNFMSPSYQADHDAALRASLTTLLSCARALPKKETEQGRHTQTGPGNSTQPLNLRFAPESELMDPNANNPPPSSTAQAIPSSLPAHIRNQPPAPRTASNSSAPSAPSAPSSTSSRSPLENNNNKPKRSAPTSSTTPARAKSPRATKKKRTASPSGISSPETTSLSPTVLTWVVSAGVLVLVSVVGFGAGYVIGREVGRQEGAAASLGGLGGLGGGQEVTVNAPSCGREVIRSSSGGGGTLRRFKWGVGRSVVA